MYLKKAGRGQHWGFRMSRDRSYNIMRILILKYFSIFSNYAMCVTKTLIHKKQVAQKYNYHFFAHQEWTYFLLKTKSLTIMSVITCSRCHWMKMILKQQLKATGTTEAWIFKTNYRHFQNADILNLMYLKFFSKEVIEFFGLFCCRRRHLILKTFLISTRRG